MSPPQTRANPLVANAFRTKWLLREHCSATCQRRRRPGQVRHTQGGLQIAAVRRGYLASGMRLAVSAEPGDLRVRRYSRGWGLLALTAGMIVNPGAGLFGVGRPWSAAGKRTVTISRSAAELLAAASSGSGWRLLMRGPARAARLVPHSLGDTGLTGPCGIVMRKTAAARLLTPSLR